MKRMVFAVVFTAVAVVLTGQRNSLDAFFNSYSDRDGYTSVTISGNLFKFLGSFDSDGCCDGPEQRITSVRIVSREKSGIPGAGFLSEIRSVIRRGAYDELMTVKDHDTDLRIMVRGRGDSVSEILVVASGDKEAVIQICGDLTREDVNRISERHASGLAQLEMLESSGKW